MNLRIGININWFARLHGTAFQNIVPIFVSRFPQASDVGCWDRARARWVVGIELGRAGVQVEGYHPRPFGMRGGCTIPPWPRFPRPPDNPGRPNFSRSGLEPWPILHEPSQTPRGLSADSHTPHDSGLPTASFHLRRRLIPTLCPGIARMTKPPSVQSPFAPRPVLPARGRRVPPPG